MQAGEAGKACDPLCTDLIILLRYYYLTCASSARGMCV